MGHPSRAIDRSGKIKSGGARLSARLDHRSYGWSLRNIDCCNFDSAWIPAVEGQTEQVKCIFMNVF